MRAGRLFLSPLKKSTRIFQLTTYPLQIMSNPRQASNNSSSLPRKPSYPTSSVNVGSNGIARRQSSATRKGTFDVTSPSTHFGGMTSPNPTCPSNNRPPLGVGGGGGGQARRLGSFNSLAKHSSTTTKTMTRSNHGSLSSGGKHELEGDWTFWFLCRHATRKMSEEEFSKAMRPLGSCSTVEDFFSLYLHLRRPSQLTPISDLHFFLSPIKPVWEDDYNISGGKWTMRIRKGLADRLWEEVVFALVGGILELGSKTTMSLKASIQEDEDQQQVGVHDDDVDDDHDGEVKEVCGAVLSIRRDEDLLAVWHRSGDSERYGEGIIAQRIKLTLQKLLNLPKSCTMLYKLNADSLAAGDKEKINSQRKRISGDGLIPASGSTPPLPSPVADM